MSTPEFGVSEKKKKSGPAFVVLMVAYLLVIATL